MDKAQEAFNQVFKVTGYDVTSDKMPRAYFEAGYKAKEAETCEWTQDEIGWVLFHHSECGHDIDPEDAPVGDYCPYCGGKIVEKETEG